MTIEEFYQSCQNCGWKTEFDTFKFSERDKWRRYDKSIVKVFAAIQPDVQFLATRGAFDKVMIILKG